jgi:hypothetical protein
LYNPRVNDNPLYECHHHQKPYILAGSTQALNIRARNVCPFQRTLGICSDERCFMCVCQFKDPTGCAAILPYIANY